MTLHGTPAGRTTVVLFTRDLRVHDHPALAEAARAGDRVAPLFVLDDTLLARTPPARAQFLFDALADLDRALQTRGGRLIVRRGDPVREALAVARAAGAQAIFASADVSGFAQRRERQFVAACAASGMEFRSFGGVTVAAPGDIRPVSGDHFRVFTPYWNRWRTRPRRPLAAPPHRIVLPAGLAPGVLPARADVVAGHVPSEVMPGGETPGRARLAAWCRSGVADYAERRDALAVAGTSRLSPYLHFGCLSAAEIEVRCLARANSEAFLRQLCWRDFYHQITAAFPAIARDDYRPQRREWRHDADLLAAWKAGGTGVPLVDAGMRQLAAEGWIHNRVRLVTASFLVKQLGLDWRLGAEHFLELLIDGDVANNSGNWQWVAGTGNDTRPYRAFNPARHAERFDPDGAYVARWVPELVR